MPVQQKSLDKVQTFPQLVAWLRDELDWPLESDNYEDISWEYDPEELGLKKNEAAKIDYIRQLRPMTDKQPFGIFFVKFNKGRLPVVALRRILSNLVVKRRSSANRADRPAWEKNDLLFLSSWSEAELRQMNFAHFADNDSRKDLPTLKVLDWGQHNTTLHVRDVEKQLHENLVWPEDTANPDTWRETWRGAFRLRHRETIDTSKALSIRLAELARAIRDRISDTLTIETDKGPLTTLLKAFQQGLVHDLDADGFADMYAQTIAYGLLSARIADPKKKTADDFAAHMRTSPFLRELMETFLAVGGRKGKAGGPGIDFDELGVSDVVELLDEANMEAVVRDFGDRNRQEDPVIHFYELFLREYNKQLKIQRGVFYTPQPVVSYIVRSVHELLQTEFGLADGLADTATWGEMLKQHRDLKLPPLTDEPGEKRTIDPDEPFVQILDPATGTATFLVEVIDIIYNTMKKKWEQQGKKAKEIDKLWNDYVPQHLLPRLHAYELMMAPYAIAHMKVGLKLAETGYRFETEERARIYLTNALEPWQKQLVLPDIVALAHEASAVNEVKRHNHFTVIIGNPPYSHRANLLSPEQRAIIEPYKYIDGERMKVRGALQLERNLNDDYVKFIRFSQTQIDLNGTGIVGLITNNAYLENLTFPGMRNNLATSFPFIQIVNLNGSVKTGGTTPDGKKDENVFDIQQGVAISILTRPLRKGNFDRRYSDVWGLRSEKERQLQNDQQALNFVKLNPTPVTFLFVPAGGEAAAENAKWKALDAVFDVFGTGIMTNRNGLTIGMAPCELAESIQLFLDQRLDDETVSRRLKVKSTALWDLHAARIKIAKLNPIDFFRPIDFRPFDTQIIFYHSAAVDNMRKSVMNTASRNGNLTLIVSRQQFKQGFRHVLVTRKMFDECFLSAASREKASGFSLLTGPNKKDELELSGDGPNLKRSFLPVLGGDDPLSAALLKFHYIYAVLHSDIYRTRYEEQLKRGYPQVPETTNLLLAGSLAVLGGELTTLHLLESLNLTKPITKFIGKNLLVTKAGWTPDGGGTVWIDGKGTAKNFQPGTSGFRPVPEEVWNFHIGGYQVCEKWLKDRGPKKGKPGRTLSKDDIVHYHKIVIALTETIRIMAEIDEVIEEHGGWPDAFTNYDEVLLKVAEQPADYSAN